MNEHLRRARNCIEQGDRFYETAAAELAAARDEGVKWEAIAEAVGKSRTWCQNLVESHKNARRAGAFEVDWNRGSHATKDEIREGVEKLPPVERAAIVRRALADPEVADEALSDDATRLRADAAAERARSANRGQTRSERASRGPRRVTQAEKDAEGIARLHAASGLIVDAWTRLARVWEEVIPTLSGDARETALGLVNLTTTNAGLIESTIRGEGDLDAALTKILSEGD